MKVNEACYIADRLESLARRITNYNKSKEDIIEELEYMARTYRDVADRLDQMMYEDYLNSEAYARERYDDALIANGL